MAALEGKVGLMKKIVICGLFGLVVGLLSPRIAAAQGSVTYISNLGQSSSGSNPVGSDSWQAASFGTGTNAGGYLLNSVQLNMTDASGNPGGFTVMIYSSVGHGNFTPGINLMTLNGPSDPGSAGSYTYTIPSSLTLSPVSVYFIVMTSSTSVADGSFAWSYGSSYSYNLAGGWQAPEGDLALDNYESGDGLHWSFVGGPAQFAINATAAPEPGVVGLLVVGGLLFRLRRKPIKN
jgi:MYXO-CTERM domain-containing protein